MKTSMKNILHHTALNAAGIGLLGLFFLLPATAMAENKLALEHYQRGQDAEKMEDLEDAIRWYEQAIAEHPDDGDIVLETRRTAKESRAYGRGIRIEYTVKNKTRPYYPNERLSVVRKQVKSSKPPQLTVDTRYADATGDNVLTPGEHASLDIVVRNGGQSKADNVALSISADRAKGLRVNSFIKLGSIAPGESKRQKVELSTDKRISSGDIRFTVFAREADGYNSPDNTIAVKSQGFLPPNLVVANIQIRDNNGNGKIEQVEFVEVTYTVRNIGVGPAHKVVANLDTSEHVRLVDDTARSQTFTSIAPGQARSASFTFYTNKRISAGSKIPLTIKVSESEGEYGSQQDLALTMNNTFSSKVEFAAAPAGAPVVPLINGAAAVPLADIDLNIPRGVSKRPDAVAVVIGNSNYTVPGVPEVTFANRDAQAMKKYLVQALGFSEENIIYAEDANLGTFNKVFGKNQNSFKGQLYNYADPDGKSDIFVFYSGHGAPDIKDQSAFIVPSDADPTYIADTGYALDTFYKNLEKVPHKSMTVVLDACFSGNSDGGFLLKDISPALIKFDMPKASIGNATLLTSSSKDEVSTWYREKGHGMFTYFFLKGLGGDADNNNDRKITTAELAAYTKKMVKRQSRRQGRQHTPVATNAGDAVLVRY